MSQKATAKTAKTAEKVFFCALCVLCGCFFLGVAACSSRKAESKATARNVLLITIDTLRADHVGAYGWTRARTPTLDALATNGALFERAFAAAPITLPSHATLLTGRYPPGHGARDNGLHVSATVPTLATELQAKGFATAAFVAAFPLDHQFGLSRGFDVYGDTLPRGPDGRPANERPASAVVNDAISWLRPPRATRSVTSLATRARNPFGRSAMATPTIAHSTHTATINATHAEVRPSFHARGRPASLFRGNPARTIQNRPSLSEQRALRSTRRMAEPQSTSCARSQRLRRARDLGAQALKR